MFIQNPLYQFVLFTALFVNLQHQARAQDMDWFPFRPGLPVSGNAIDMRQWLDKPAGKHGHLDMNGNSYRFADGTPIKFWGVNIAGDEPFSKKERVKAYTEFLQHYGINAVRFHKFTWEATDGVHSTVITPENWDRFDFFSKSLRDAGIYLSWSHIYGHRLMQADSSRVLAYAEVRDTKFPWSHLNGTTASLVNFAEDLQNINIELTVNMLNHVNVHTGTRYADDPSLVIIELQNEDNIYWAAIEETLKQAPTYRKLLCAQFSSWLGLKYGTTEKLKAAWGKALPEGETIEGKNIYPRPNHGYFSHASEKAQLEGKAVPPQVSDAALFLFECQQSYYQRFIKAIRNTGFKGAIAGSCWQAGSGISHYYNLYADYQAGVIDRHNYFGGGTGHSLKPGKFDNRSMLSQPGSGLLSTGFQQVADRPFQVSEWMSLIPNEWTAESAPIIAAYGMGLQGWDASFAFAMDQPEFTPTIQRGSGIYNVTSPLQLAIYPALANMIYRKDLREGQPAAIRNISIDDLKKGIITVKEKTSQQYDLKEFFSEVPAETLAAGPVLLSFRNDSLASQINRNKNYEGSESRQILSNTGQLIWNFSGKGYFTINSPGTTGSVGFTAGKSFSAGPVQWKSGNQFAVILVSSLDKENDLTNAKRVLITTMARAKNKGMTFNADTTALLSTGGAPVLIEPVNVTMKLNRPKIPAVYALDHSGNRTHKIPVSKNGRLELDGNRYKTIYYELVY